jgi:preprotein translocase subunit SecE
VARDRKRAKQRQQRRTRQGVPAPAPSEIHRADLPGALEHASSDVDEFDAALVRGAGGVPVEAEAMPTPESRSPEAPAEPLDAQRNGGEERDASAPPPLAPAGGGAGRRGGDNGAALEAFGEGAAEPAPRERRQSLPRRAVGFLRASWAELQRVQWPDRRQVSQATAVVLGFVAIAGAYLGAADWVAQRIVNFVL